MIRFLPFALLLLLSGCGEQSFEIATDTGNSVKARVVAIPKDHDWWQGHLLVEERKTGALLADVLIGEPSDHPIPYGFVGIALREREDGVDVVLTDFAQYYVAPVRYRGGVSPAVGINRGQSVRPLVQDEYATMLGLFAKELEQQKRRDLEGKGARPTWQWRFN